MKSKIIPITILLSISVILLVACGGTGSTNPDGSPVDEAQLRQGELIFQANCAACHSASNAVVLVGPSLVGISNRAANKVDGLDARGYIEQSILDPGAYINEGFQNLMPNTYGNTLSEDDLNALIAFLMSLN